jgi:hypothetical protein
MFVRAKLHDLKTRGKPRRFELACALGYSTLSVVMAGLDPAIHLLRKNAFIAKWMDPRDKPAGDSVE